MLTKLNIRNIILLKQVTIEFADGLTVLTGETGAGKSILLDALGLILGKKSDGKMVRSGEQAGYVIAEFDITDNSALHEWLNEQGIEADNHLIIRKNIKADGSSKALVNDQAVTQKLLKELGAWLIIIYGQHDSRGLLEAAKHQQMLDIYSGLDGELKRNIAQYFRQYRESQRSIEALQQEIEAAMREQDYLKHVEAELSKLNPQQGEEDELTTERAQLLMSEKMGALLQENEQILSGGASPIAQQLRNVQLNMMRSSLSEKPQVNHIIESLERCLNELAEAEIALSELSNETNYDEAKLERISERLFSLKEAARKHRVSVEELPQYLDEVRNKLNKTQNGQAEIARLSKQANEYKAKYFSLAKQLREIRLKACDELCADIHQNLAQLKMSATKVRVKCEVLPEANWRESGIDDIAFEVATNVGSAFGSLASIASGGELSRFMLAMAVVLNKSGSAPMMIFDEIDTGTGGAVADAIGMKLAELAQNQQVVVVTHLAQVAARSNAHLYISKNVEDGGTITNVIPLDKHQSKEELARMLSGAVITDAARLAAADLLEYNNK